MPKILYITRPLCSPWDEASKNFAYTLAKNMSSGKGDESDKVVVMTNGQLEDLPTNVLQHDIYSTCQFGTRAKLEAIWYQLRHRLKLSPHRTPADIAHYFFTPTPLNAWISRALLPPATKTIQTIATLRDERFSPAQLRKMLFADKLVTYTDETKTKIADLGFDNVSRIYPGIDLAHFTPTDKPTELLRKFDIPTDAITVSYSGEYVRLGATDTIIEAMEQLWASSAQFAQNLILIMAVRVKNEADAQKKQEIITHLRKTGNLDKVRFTDTFADMRGIYNLSDIVLFPVANMHGKFDVPLALIEAYACGRATIVSDISRLAEFTDTAFTSIIKPCDANLLSAQIAKLAQDSNLRKMLGDEARKFAQNSFDINKTTRKYEELYKALSE